MCGANWSAIADMAVISANGGRPWTFYLLGTIFTFYVLFLYGPMLCIYILSFQGPQGGLSFPMRGSAFIGSRN